mgnify:CR=1 FL=1
MIEKLVKEELNQKVWSFSEIANVSETVENLAQAVYDKMPTTDKLKLVWDTEVFAEERTAFGHLYMDTIMAELRIKIAGIVRAELLEAKVSFKEEIKNEDTKRSVGRKSSKKRTTDEKKDNPLTK